MAFRELINKNISVKLDIAGSGPLKKYLVSLAKKLNIHSHICFLGQQSRESILKIIISADAIVSSSCFETFSVVLLEAIACGKPIVSTSSGGPNYIVNKINGLLTPPNDPLQLADAMLKIQNNITHYDAFKIKNDFLERFGEASFITKMKSLYRHVLMYS